MKNIAYIDAANLDKECNRFIGIISPAPKDRCSIILKRTNPKIFYMNDKRKILESK